MSNNKTVELINPLETVTSPENPDGKVKRIVFRTPRYRDVMRLGEPQAFARTEAGVMFSSEKDEIVQAYIETLMVEPLDKLLLEQVSLADALRLKDAIFDFFMEARTARAAASTSS